MIAAAGDVVVFRRGEREFTGILIHNMSETTTECSIRTRARTYRMVPPSDILSATAPPPYEYRPQGSKLRTAITWYSNSAVFHDEVWRIRQKNGSHGTTWIEMPQWAIDVAFAHEIRTRWEGYGFKKHAREVAQLIVDKAIETGAYPHERAAS